MLDKNQRYISRLTRDTYALILAGGKGSRLHELTEWRAKPSVYFGGKFRIIDFPLSNCVNSGIKKIGVATQYKAHSLIKHLVRGWSHVNVNMGEFVDVLPASQRTSDHWYAGTADAIYQNIDIIRAHNPKYVLVLSGDHIYKMDYGEMLAYHVESGADMTVSCMEVPIEEAAGAYGVMTVDDQFRIQRFDEKPANPTPLPQTPDMTLASMGNYVFNTEFLFEQLIKDADNQDSEHDFGKNIIPSIIKSHKVYAFPFREPGGKRAYWRDVGTLDAFWEANMELISVVPELNLYDEKWPILTYQLQQPPAKFVLNESDRVGMATDSMVSGGCVISGARLNRSLLFSDVTVHSYSLVEDSVVLPEVDIGRHCHIRKAIIDRGVHIPPNTNIGIDKEEDIARGFRVTDKGVTLVTAEMLGQKIHYTR
ncbi:glucose-1-phosphate adenylyltransferase [Aliiglaciecola sp. CAU 1673]|uniref:glucose-1-phosphate adenylyltransferase n=1 Tax=Aliiglaciecola sp. CAU 1673 TaxID=3032595 RepID=UPI0023DB03A0|nr:glucose-1-phosphate adenylyltransferase [Aliiglaciecola sp. CAU 1673]MDF2178044.1 glucose-1-phosphate adenylyltransferase [Aliiglaciecola sp. CAU 1673]